MMSVYKHILVAVLLPFAVGCGRRIQILQPAVTEPQSTDIPGSSPSPSPTPGDFRLSLSKQGDGLVKVYDGVNLNTLSIQCGTQCEKEYPADTQVKVVAVPSAGNTFAGWTGDCSGSSQNCTLKMSSARSVRASFVSNPVVVIVTHSLAVTKHGEGTVSGYATNNTNLTLSCGSQCERAFENGTMVALTATPATGSTFVSWEGACIGTNNLCNVTMAAAKSVTANFSSNAYTLSLSKQGFGSINGSVVGDPTNTLSCGSQCSRNFNANSQVSLTAVPDAGNIFVNWTGECSGSASPCTITMSAAKSVTANFAAAAPSELSFAPLAAEILIGDVYSGSSQSRTFTVTNSLTVSAIIGAANLSSSVTPFSISANTCSNATLSPNGTCSLTVKFAPSFDPANDQKSWNALLSVSYSVGQTNRSRTWNLQATSHNTDFLGTVSLSGPSVIARKTCTPYTVQVLSASDAPLYFTFPLTLDATILNGNVGLYADSGCTLPTLSVTIPAGQNQIPTSGTIYVRGGWYYPSVSLRVGGADVIQDTHAIAVGYLSEPEISPTSDTLDFGQVARGATQTRILRFKSTRENSIRVTSALFTSGDARGFSISDDRCSGTTIALGAECTITISFSALPDQTSGDARIKVFYEVGNDSYSVERRLIAQVASTPFSSVSTLTSSWQYDSTRIAMSATGARLASLDQVDDDNSFQGFGGGSFQNAVFDYSHSAMRIESGSSGSFTSRVFGTLGIGSWTSLSWTPLGAYSAPLPNQRQSDRGLDMGALGNIALFHFDDPNDLTVTDDSGVGGTVTTRYLTRTAGKVGSARAFNMTQYNSRVKLDPLNSVASSAMSVTLWVKMPRVTTDGKKTLFSYYANADQMKLYHYSSSTSNHLVYWIRGGSQSTGTRIDNDQWTHVALTWERLTGRSRLYLNGAQTATSIESQGESLVRNGILYLGQDYDSTNGFQDDEAFRGELDEVAVFNKALTAEQVLEIYRRGAHRIKFQVAGCETQNCANATFTGPSGSASDYYMDLGQATANFTLTNYPYFRYRAILESDDSESPKFSRVSVGPAHYDASMPTVTQTVGVDYGALSAFSEQTGPTHQGSVKYQLSPDGTRWFYFDGAVWRGALTELQTSTAAEVNSAIASFASVAGPGQLRVRAFLRSPNGTAPVELQSISVTGTR